MKTNWKYVTGFFDADGSIYKDRKYWRLNFSNYEEDVIDTIHSFLLSKHVTALKYDKTKHNRGFEIRINRKDDVFYVVTQFLKESRLGYKREKMKQALDDLKNE